MLTVPGHNLLDRDAAVGQQRVAVKTAYLHQALANKGVTGLPLAHLALVHHAGHGIGDAQQTRLGGLQLRVHELPRGDVGANGYKLSDDALVITQGHHRGLHPIMCAIFGLVAYFAMPHLARQNHTPQVAEKCFGVGT